MTLVAFALLFVVGVNLPDGTAKVLWFAIGVPLLAMLHVKDSPDA